MWEYSVNFGPKSDELASCFFDSIRKDILSCNGVVVLSKQKEGSKIVLAVDEALRPEIELAVLRSVSYAICNFFKADFLNRHLSLSNQDEMSMTAFKKALINFDKETDYFLISKILSFDGNLFLESFYRFKLPKLRDKWQELVRLANENRDYLVSADAFNDLLKFLIDNLDICRDEVDVIEEENERYYVCEQGEKKEAKGGSALISLLIDLSPQKINFYYKNETHATDLLKIIFDRRLNLLLANQNSRLNSNVTPLLR